MPIRCRLKNSFAAIAAVAVTFAVRAQAVTPAGTVFTYQGHLKQGGAPVNASADFQFRLFDAESGGNQVGALWSTNNVAVTDGGFTVDVDFGALAFNADERWLDISVRSPAGTGVFTLLTPRQPIRPTPVSQFAMKVDGAAVTNLNAANITVGSISWARMPVGGTWPLSSAMQVGNALSIDPGRNHVGVGTSAPTQALHVEGNLKVSGWIGTDSNQAVDIVTNNKRAIRVEDAVDGRGQSCPNIIGGAEGNSLAAGVVGAAIAGGGSPTEGFNHVTASYGFIGGGFDNVAGFAEAGTQNSLVPSFPPTVGGGAHNEATATGATVSGGAGNTASGPLSTVGGGFVCTASGSNSTVVGGHTNTASGGDSTVCGGGSNVASGLRSTIPGGFFNSATGDHSFAAGTAASANHLGAFVWGDSTLQAFESTAPNQFIIRAGGGVGIGTNAPGAPFHVQEFTTVGITPSASASMILERNASANYLQMIGADTAEIGLMFGKPSHGASGGIYYNSSGATPSGLNFRTNGNSIKMVVLSNGNVGIGTTAPAQLLSVNGSAGKPGGGSWAVFSDERLKKNIQTLHRSLDRLLCLRGVSFEYIDPQSINEQPGTRMGMIAQEVEQVFPEWVDGASGEFKSLSFSGFEALTVEALRDLREEKDQELAQLRAEKDAELAQLKSRIDSLESIVQQLLASNTRTSIHDR